MNEDLRIIREAILKIDLKILPVGSAGLFRQFFPPHSFRDTYPCLGGLRFSEQSESSSSQKAQGISPSKDSRAKSNAGFQEQSS